MSTGTVLLEIFSEEIPARMQKDVSLQIGNTIQKQLNEALKCKVDLNSWHTPRRMGFYITNIAGIQQDSVEEVRGPRLSAPQQALAGFMKKYSVKSESDLVQKNDFYFFNQKIKAQDVKQVLSEVITNILNNTVWPKSMRWNHYEMRWARPVHALLCLYNEDVLPVSLGHINSSSFTFGHRFLSDGAKIEVKSYQHYLEIMANNSVVLSPDERKEIILQEASKIANSKDLSIIHDKEVLDEVVGMTECPVILLGKIEAKFMKLPEEILIASIRNNQKYIMMRDKNNKLAPYFIIVSNMKAEDGGDTIIQGNEKVLSARLYDAEFFFENDKKMSFKEKINKLEKVTYHAKLGSVVDKVKANCDTLRKLADLDQVNIKDQALEYACYLSKTDLVTEVVGEMPELQGIMGYYYALHDKESLDVAIAIRDHYKPQGPSDEIPANDYGCLIALADKIETIKQLFSINIKPTGSKDPFALRRAAIGVIRIITEKGYNISLERLGLEQDVLDFIAGRFVIVMKEKYGQLDTELIKNKLNSNGFDLTAIITEQGKS